MSFVSSGSGSLAEMATSCCSRTRLSMLHKLHNIISQWFAAYMPRKVHLWRFKGFSIQSYQFSVQTEDKVLAAH
jgi:hypothetical protein